MIQGCSSVVCVGASVRPRGARRVSRASFPGRQRRSVAQCAMSQDELKQLAAEKAVEYVKSGMKVGLGTGSTAAKAVAVIGAKLKSGELKDLVCVPTSVATFDQATSLGIPLATLDTVPRLDVTIDGADEYDDNMDLVKGRGGALLREKMVELSSDAFVCIVDDSKYVKGLGISGAMPVEITQFCWEYNLRRIQALPELAGCRAMRRTTDGPTPTPTSTEPYVTDNGNYIVDLYFDAPIKDAKAAGEAINALVGVVEHGLFIGMASTIIVAAPEGIKVIGK